MTSDETPTAESAGRHGRRTRSGSCSSTTTRCSAPGVRGELAGRRPVDVVAEAADVDQAVAAINAHRPDVVLLDVHLPGGGGVEVMQAGADARRPATSRCRSATPPRT